MGGRDEPSAGVVDDGEASLEGDPLVTIALKAGGLYLAPILSSACISLALEKNAFDLVSMGRRGKER